MRNTVDNPQYLWGRVIVSPRVEQRSTRSTRLLLAASTLLAGVALLAVSASAQTITPSAPSAPTATAGVESATVSFSAPSDNGPPITSYTVTSAPGGAQVTVGGSPLTMTGLAPRTSYTFTVTATNADGTSVASPPSAPVTVLAPSSGSSGPSGPTGSTTPGTSPELSKIVVSLISFFAASSGGPTTEKQGVGTTFAYQDSEAATSTLAFFRVTPGIKHNGACVAPRAGLKGKSCARRYTAAGSFTHADIAGANKIHFSGRVDGHALPAGLYQVRITPTLDGVAGTTLKSEFDIF